MSVSLPGPGYGLGLRSAYYAQILEQSPPVDWFEIVSENYMVQGGKALYYLDAIVERYPVVMHGVSLSIGGPHALDRDYLDRLQHLAERVRPAWVVSTETVGRAMLAVVRHGAPQAVIEPADLNRLAAERR